MGQLDDNAQLERTLQEVFEVIEALTQRGLIRNCESNKERAIYLKDCAEDFFYVCEALNEFAPDKHKLQFGPHHADMLWAIFIKMRESDEYRPRALDANTIINIYRDRKGKK